MSIYKNPTVSIIIPVFNAENYLLDSLKSIVNQSFHDFEVIVIDDGSTDNSGKIVSELLKLDSRIKYFYQKNKGVSAARNFGLSKSKGKYIFFVDPDDKCNEMYLDNFIKALVKEYDLVGSGYTSVEKKKNLIRKRVPTSLGEVSQADCFNLVINDDNFYSFPWNKMYKREIISKFHIKFDESISYGEDLLFLITYIKCCKSFFIISASDYLYSIHDNGITSNFSREGLIKRMTYLTSMEKVEDILSEQLKEIKKLLHARYLYASCIIYREMSKTEFSRIERKSLKNKLIEKYKLIKKDIKIKGRTKFILTIYFPTINEIIMKNFRS